MFGVIAALAVAMQTPQQAAPSSRAVSRELMRDAYRDDESRSIVRRARVARSAQDSSLESYEANGRQRMTVSAGVASGAQRAAYRVESAFQVRWQDGVGAQVELTGARVGVPILPEVENETLQNAVRNPDLTPIPYSSGREALWPVSGTGSGATDDRLEHPLAIGAEASYTYQSGATTRIGLPDKRELVLRELKVRPRSARANLAVGSLWFDDATGQLVRASYRLAAPITLHVLTPNTVLGESKKPNPIVALILKGIVSPFKVQIAGVVVEYALYDGRYWLPKSRFLEANARVSFANVRVVMEQSFTYRTINGPAMVAKIALNEPSVDAVSVPASLSGERLRQWRDSVRVAATSSYRARMKAFEDSLTTGACDSTGKRIVAGIRSDIGLPVAVVYPCDVGLLAKSPDFGGSVYAANEDVFDSKTSHDILERALPFGAQSAITLDELARPDVQYGLSMTRYNRIEGLSSGLHAEQQLGDGYFTGLTARIGSADHELNGDVSVARTNLTKTLTARGYRRLVAANDWGDPLSFGSSASALLFGRDEGFYYRASGVELTWTGEGSTQLNWRLFAEQERTAAQRAYHTFGSSFGPNVEATSGRFAGAGVRWLRVTGIDPRGLRTITDARLEAAAGDSAYGRAALDVTLARAIAGRLSGSVTLSGGDAVGALPPQRRWFLGGTQTIRGQTADTAQSGNAFWMTRGELASVQRGYRVTVFSDLGWVGSHSFVPTVGHSLGGAGVGVSALDGLIRLDVARGLYRLKRTRVTFSIGKKF